jgi:hypothetical protein
MLCTLRCARNFKIQTMRANHRLHPTTGILPVKLGYRRLEVGSDPENDLIPPVAGETGRWLDIFGAKYYH